MSDGRSAEIFIAGHNNLSHGYSLKTRSIFLVTKLKAISGGGGERRRMVGKFVTKIRLLIAGPYSN